MYFFGLPFHAKAVAVARETQRLAAYPLCYLVTWIVMCSNLTGYLTGSWRGRSQRTPTGATNGSAHPTTS